MLKSISADVERCRVQRRYALQADIQGIDPCGSILLQSRRNLNA